MEKISNVSKFARGLLLSLGVIVVPGLASAQTYPSKNYFVFDNPGDLNFNQLLGISDNQIIVGYFGDGATVFNNGYMFVPKFHYAPENYQGAPLSTKTTITQTQAIGINSNEVPITVGFWADQKGVQYGWASIRGPDVKTSFQTILDPLGAAGTAAGMNQNLLGVNNHNLAAGFWTDITGNEHGFVVNLDAIPRQFKEIPPNKFAGAIATQASGINDNNIVCGFWVDKSKNDHGFFGPLGGNYTTFNYPKATSTTVLGCSNKLIVGSYVDTGGNTHGFLFDGNKTFQSFDATGSTQTAAFGVAGTFINGVNDRGDIVGFFSDGKKVHGFVNFAVATGNQ